jgi:hypothetical protein
MMTEFLTHAALIVLVTTVTGVLIAGAAHYAQATDRRDGRRSTRGAGE